MTLATFSLWFVFEHRILRTETDGGVRMSTGFTIMPGAVSRGSCCYTIWIVSSEFECFPLGRRTMLGRLLWRSLSGLSASNLRSASNLILLSLDLGEICLNLRKLIS